MNRNDLIGLTLMIIGASNLSKLELDIYFRTASVLTFIIGFYIIYKKS